MEDKKQVRLCHAIIPYAFSALIATIVAFKRLSYLRDAHNPDPSLVFSVTSHSLMAVFFVLLIVFLCLKKTGKEIPVLFAAFAVCNGIRAFGCYLWEIIQHNSWIEEHPYSSGYHWEPKLPMLAVIAATMLAGVLLAGYLEALSTQKSKYQKFHYFAKRFWYLPPLLRLAFFLLYIDPNEWTDYLYLGFWFENRIVWYCLYIFGVAGMLLLCRWLKDPYEKARKEATIPAAENGETATERTAGDTTEKANGAIYYLKGARGRRLAVYENKVIITVKAGAGSLLTGNATDGEKTIYFSDCIGIQYKKCGVTLGYLQFETAGGLMNNKASNFFNENAFTWDVHSLEETGTTEAKMEEVANYCKKRVDEIKSQKAQPVTVVSAAPSISPADELLKYKSLLDAGALTQEEFDAKKKQLLGL